MSLPALDNLVRIGQLKAERRNDAEVGRMLAMACKVIRHGRRGAASGRSTPFVEQNQERRWIDGKYDEKSEIPLLQKAFGSRGCRCRK
jgi:hypothetical protein